VTNGRMQEGMKRNGGRRTALVQGEDRTRHCPALKTKHETQGAGVTR
jgi:hypothetical protein